MIPPGLAATSAAGTAILKKMLKSGTSCLGIGTYGTQGPGSLENMLNGKDMVRTDNGVCRARKDF